MALALKSKEDLMGKTGALGLRLLSMRGRVMGELVDAYSLRWLLRGKSREGSGRKRDMSCGLLLEVPSDCASIFWKSGMPSSALEKVSGFLASLSDAVFLGELRMEGL